MHISIARLPKKFRPLKLSRPFGTALPLSGYRPDGGVGVTTVFYFKLGLLLLSQGLLFLLYGVQ